MIYAADCAILDVSPDGKRDEPAHRSIAGSVVISGMSVR